MRPTIAACLAAILLVACREPQKQGTMQEHAPPQESSSTGKQYIDDFFTAYESSFNKGLAEGGESVQDVITASFADCFVESGPTGVLCGTNDKSFQKKIAEGFELYKKIGSISMKVVSKHVTALDSLHDMVKVGWRYTAMKNEKEVVVDFENIYFLVTQENKTKIFAYIAGDEQKALKENGLMD